MVKDSVLSKLSFAKKRLDEICQLVSSNSISVDANLRQQITQEYFFHLLGAVEYLAQLVNKNLDLGIDPAHVSVYKVCEGLRLTRNHDPLIPILDALSVDTKKPFPTTDPFAGKGLVYRLINYRNEVVHRNTNPFHFSMREGPGFAEFWLDPREHSIGKTGVCVDVDLKSMFNIVEQQIQAALQHV